MPKARAPKAPCVLVWLSPQTMVLPGWVAPCSGPMMCTMPRRESCNPIRFTPNSAQFTSSWRTCLRSRFELDRQAAEDLRRVGRRRVVHRRQRAVEPANLELAGAQDVERLGRGDLVRQVQVDVQDRGRVGRLGHDDVPLPHFLEQALHGHSSSGRSRQTAAAGGVSFWSAPRRREDSMALITSMKARTPDSTMSVVTLVPR